MAELRAIKVGGGVTNDAIAEPGGVVARTCGHRGVGALAVLALALVGCTQQVAGTGQWNPAAVSSPLSAEHVKSIIVDPQTLTDLVGSPIAVAVNTREPVAGSELGECGVLSGPGIAAFIGSGWDDFTMVVSNDDSEGAGHDHAVAQAVVIYADAAAAVRAYERVVAQGSECDGVTADGSTGSSWKYAVPEDQNVDDALRWSGRQVDAARDWRCFGETRARGNALLRSMTCQVGRDGEENNDAVMAAMADAVWSLSGPTAS